MNKINPIAAAGLVVLALIVLVFAIRRSANTGRVGDADLIPKPRAGSPTFTPRPEDVAAGKSKTRKAPDTSTEVK